MTFITTFGSSTLDEGTKEYAEGVEIGRFLVGKGYALKCGGYGGLMEAVSRGAKEGGGKCIGITLEHFEAKREKNPYLSEKIVCKTLYERLEKLIEGSEAFVVQNGSLGTLNELFLVWTIAYIGLDTSFKIYCIGEEFETLKNLALSINPKLFELVTICKDTEDFKNKFNNRA